MELPKHFCKFKGHEAVVCGYRPSMNQCMIVLVGSLPQDEGMELRRIAMSSVAQEHDYLVPTLQVELHKSQADWFSHLCTRMKRNDGAVVEISIKELDDMNPHQKSFFKGDGEWVASYNDRGIQTGRKWARNTAVKAEVPPQVDPALLANPSTTSAGVGGMLTEDASLAAQTARVAAQTAGPAAPVDPTLAAILGQLVEGQKEMAAAVEKLASKVKPATKRKTANKRKPAAKKSASVTAAVNG